MKTNISMLVITAFVLSFVLLIPTDGTVATENSNGAGHNEITYFDTGVGAN